MKQSEVRESSVAELQDKLVETRKAYSDLKMAHAVSPLEISVHLRTVRRSIARIATELTKREQQ